MDPGGGPPGWFVGVFVLVIIFGVATTVWRVSTAQKLAKRSGMDPGLATQMTLLSDDGLDATYLAANLRGHVQPGSETATEPQPTPPTTAARLEELRSLLDRGLISQQEHDERRKAIIESV
jgi:hypothetical protein